jgi:hypothetical protein
MLLSNFGEQGVHEPGIVYTLTQKEAEKTATYLQGLGAPPTEFCVALSGKNSCFYYISKHMYAIPDDSTAVTIHLLALDLRIQ